MSTLSEHKSNEGSTRTGMQPGDTKGQIDRILQQFDVLPSRFDKFMFKSYIYLAGFLFLGELLTTLSFTLQPRARIGLLTVGVTMLPMLVIISYIWTFNTWRLSAPKTLRDVLEKKRIYLHNGNANTSYLHFLESYSAAISSPKRCFLGFLPVIIYSGISTYVIVRSLSITHLNIFVMLLFMVGSLLIVFSYVGGLYCSGIGTWVMLISGWYVRKLAQTFEFTHIPQFENALLEINYCSFYMFYQSVARPRSPITRTYDLFSGTSIWKLCYCCDDRYWQYV